LPDTSQLPTGTFYLIPLPGYPNIYVMTMVMPTSP
jgi:hypothetical protein